MIDMMIAIGAPTLLWTRRPSATGIPLLFTVFGTMWTFAMFPTEMYDYDAPSPIRLVALIVCTDLIQTIVHAMIHKRWLGERALRAHQIHHVYKSPSPDVAFETGVMDAVLQIIAPLYATLCLIRPDRCTAILFGMAYSQWLLYIHTGNADHGIPFLVSPRYHATHHTHPHKHFGHVICIA